MKRSGWKFGGTMAASLLAMVAMMSPGKIHGTGGSDGEYSWACHEPCGLSGNEGRGKADAGSDRRCEDAEVSV